MKKQILIVDDESKLRQLFSRILADEHREIHTAASGSQALERLKTQAFDVVLLDLKMPGMNGVETLRGIRKMDRQVPVYLVTAFQNEFRAALQKLQSEGVAFEILHKPVEKEQLRVAVEGALSGPLIV
jgi:CheY-like chemotaxis protein